MRNTAQAADCEVTEMQFSMTVTFERRGDLRNEEISELHAEGSDHGDADEEWVGRLSRLSPGWVTARDDQCLVGFVNVALHRRHAIVASVQLRESHVG